ncbi:MAG: hypothetical protein HND41_11150 [Chlorobi bacterium]|jgi:hypothetical protein|nr:hypothetical protein [Chlorobiota bacterium]
MGTRPGRGAGRLGDAGGYDVGLLIDSSVLIAAERGRIRLQSVLAGNRVVTFNVDEFKHVPGLQAVKPTLQ